VTRVRVGKAAARCTLGVLRLQERAGVAVFAMREAVRHRHHFDPPVHHTLAEHDVLIAGADHRPLDTMRTIATEG
jgi:uncharacterized protein with PhoU and TrkA domain